jgi:hypothetical protein
VQLDLKGSALASGEIVDKVGIRTLQLNKSQVNTSINCFTIRALTAASLGNSLMSTGKVSVKRWKIKMSATEVVLPTLKPDALHK